MATGRVVRFDDVRGYGFIAPDDGGEDVFIHANTVGSDKSILSPGVPVEFEACESDRGLKAISIRVITMGEGASAQARPPSKPSKPSKTVQPANVTSGEEDGLCDVLSAVALTNELTDQLLDAAPTLTGVQIKQVRTVMVELARKHGWTED